MVGTSGPTRCEKSDLTTEKDAHREIGASLGSAVIAGVPIFLSHFGVNITSWHI